MRSTYRRAILFFQSIRKGLFHAGNGWVFSAEGGGYEYPLFLIAASATQVLLGDGAYALKAGLPFIGNRAQAHPAE